MKQKILLLFFIILLAGCTPIQKHSETANISDETELIDHPTYTAKNIQEFRDQLEKENKVCIISGNTIHCEDNKFVLFSDRTLYSIQKKDPSVCEEDKKCITWYATTLKDPQPCILNLSNTAYPWDNVGYCLGLVSLFSNVNYCNKTNTPESMKTCNEIFNHIRRRFTWTNLTDDYDFRIYRDREIQTIKAYEKDRIILNNWQEYTR